MAREVQCPYCGARFTVPETVSIAVCPYCGTTVRVETGERLAEHYMYDARFDVNSAYRRAIGVALRQFAAPEDLGSGASIARGLLHYVPLYLFHIRVIASCPDNPEAGIEERYVSVLATSTRPRGLSRYYPFPTRGRRYFEPAKLEMGKYHQPDVKPEEILERLTPVYAGRALMEAYNDCDEPKVRDESRWEGLVHYPFWELAYTYNGEEYYALVDATDGTVVYLEYPIAGKKRGALAAGAIASLAAGLVGGILGGHYAMASLAVAPGHAAWAAAGIVSGVPAAYRLLRLGTAPRGTYTI